MITLYLRLLLFCNKLLTTIQDNLKSQLNQDDFIAYCLKQPVIPFTPTRDCDDFVESIQTARQDLHRNLDKFKDRELKDDVPGNLFSYFKEIRQELTSWYRSTEHFCKRSNKFTTQPVPLMQLTVTFSPAVVDDKRIDAITALLTKFKNHLELQLADNVLESLSDIHAQLMDKWQCATKSDEKFVWAKVYRSVIRKFEGSTSRRSTPTPNSDDDSPAEDRSRSTHRRGQTFRNSSRRRQQQPHRQSSGTSNYHRRQQQQHRRSDDSDYMLSTDRQSHRTPNRRHTFYNQRRQRDQSPSPDVEDSDSGSFRQDRHFPPGRRRFSSTTSQRGSVRRIL
jgi:hypothetical protein